MTITHKEQFTYIGGTRRDFMMASQNGSWHGDGQSEGCPHSARCVFYAAVVQSPVLRVRFVSAHRFCRGGDHTECARFRAYQSGGTPTGNLLPSGALDPSVTGKPTRVLVVDDVPVFRKLMEGMVGKVVEGAEVLPAENAEHALTLLSANEVDLVVTDFNMPGMDGDELVEQIRRRRETTLVPIIVLTTETDPAKRERVEAHPRVRWVHKTPDHNPFNIAVAELFIEGRSN